MAANESTVGEGTTVSETKREKGLDAKQFLLDLATGADAAIFAKICMAPVEFCKAHTWEFMQVTQHYRSPDMRGAIGVMPRDPRDGFFARAFAFQSKTASMGMKERVGHIVRYCPMQALSFAFKETYRNVLIKRFDLSYDLHKKMAVNIVSGGAAGVTSLCLVYPLDLVRARLGTDVGRAGYMGKGLGGCMRSILKSEGPLGFYRGFSARVPTVFVYHAFYFGVFDTVKMALTDEDKKLGFFTTFALACMATFGAGIVSTRFSLAIHSLDEMSLMMSKKDLFFKGSLSSAFRSPGGVLLLILFEQSRNLQQ